jgi:hypothetical protein
MHASLGVSEDNYHPVAMLLCNFSSILLAAPEVTIAHYVIHKKLQTLRSVTKIKET